MTATPHSFHVGLVALVAVIVATAAMFLLAPRLIRQAANILCRCSVALGSFDANIVDRFGVDGVARLTRLISRGLVVCDAWLVDGVMNASARIVWGLSFPARMIQTGSLRSYMLLIVIGLIGFLGYYIYVTQHTIL
jgi:hypothetical protein